MDDDANPSGCHCHGPKGGAMRLCGCGVAGKGELPHFALAECKHLDARETEVPRSSSTGSNPREPGRISTNHNPKNQSKAKSRQKLNAICSGEAVPPTHYQKNT